MHLNSSAKKCDLTLYTAPYACAQYNLLLQTVQVMNWDYTESLKRFQRILEAQGISEALSNLGAKQGDLVMIGTMRTLVIASMFALYVLTKLCSMQYINFFDHIQPNLDYLINLNTS